MVAANVALHVHWKGKGFYLRRVPRSTLLPWDFDDREGVARLIETVRMTGRLEAIELEFPNSGDSWRAFARGHPECEAPTWEESVARAKWRKLVQDRHDAALAEQRKRQLAKQAEADRLWKEQIERELAEREAERARRHAAYERRKQREEAEPIAAAEAAHRARLQAQTDAAWAKLEAEQKEAARLFEEKQWRLAKAAEADRQWLQWEADRQRLAEVIAGMRSPPEIITR